MATDVNINTAPALPNGYTLDAPASQVPAGYTLDNSATNNGNFFQRVGSDLQNRNQQVGDIFKQTMAGNEDSVGGGLYDAFGKGIGGSVGDLIKEGAQSGAAGFSNVFPGATSDIKSATSAIVNSPIGQMGINALKTGAGAWNNFKAQNPVIAQHIESTGDFANLIPASGIADVAGPAISDAGKAIYASGEAAGDAKKGSFLQDLITPKQTPSVKADLFSRSTQQGLLGTRIAEPTIQEQSIIGTLSNLPVSPMKSLNKNYNIIADAKDAEAENLSGFLKNNDAKIPDDTLINSLSDARAQLAKNPWATTADGSKAADAVINGALETIQNNPQTASGVLQARKDFDSWISGIKSDGVFDPNLETPITAAVRQVRQTLNNIVSNAVPDANVQQSLKTQSNMYRAMDAIETKGGYEGKNVISRIAQKTGNVIPGKGMIAKGAVLLGGSTGAALAPAIATGVGAAYLAGKAIKSPITRKAIGLGLSGIGDAITPGSTSIANIMAKNALKRAK